MGIFVKFLVGPLTLISTIYIKSLFFLLLSWLQPHKPLPFLFSLSSFTIFSLSHFTSSISSFLIFYFLHIIPSPYRFLTSNPHISTFLHRPLRFPASRAAAAGVFRRERTAATLRVNNGSALFSGELAAVRRSSDSDNIVGKLLFLILASYCDLGAVERVGVLGTCLLDMNSGGEDIVYSLLPSSSYVGWNGFNKNYGLLCFRFWCLSEIRVRIRYNWFWNMLARFYD